MTASAKVTVRILSPSLIFTRFETIRLNAEVMFSSPCLLPRGFPVRPLRNWFALGGLPYPTSQGESVALELGFFIACSSSTWLIAYLGDRNYCSSNLPVPLESRSCWGQSQRSEWL